MFDSSHAHLSPLQGRGENCGNDGCRRCQTGFVGDTAQMMMFRCSAVPFEYKIITNSSCSNVSRCYFLVVATFHVVLGYAGGSNNENDGTISTEAIPLEGAHECFAAQWHELFGRKVGSVQGLCRAVQAGRCSSSADEAHRLIGGLGSDGVHAAKKRAVLHLTMLFKCSWIGSLRCAVGCGRTGTLVLVSCMGGPMAMTCRQQWLQTHHDGFEEVGSALALIEHPTDHGSQEAR